MMGRRANINIRVAAKYERPTGRNEHSGGGGCWGKPTFAWLRWADGPTSRYDCLSSDGGQQAGEPT